MCERFDKCNAPICPEDEQSRENSIWYIDEQICKNEKYAEFAEKQKLIKKNTKDKNTYYTYKLIMETKEIKKGFDPNKTH